MAAAAVHSLYRMVVALAAAAVHYDAVATLLAAAAVHCLHHTAVALAAAVHYGITSLLLALVAVHSLHHTVITLVAEIHSVHRMVMALAARSLHCAAMALRVAAVL